MCQTQTVAQRSNTHVEQQHGAAPPRIVPRRRWLGTTLYWLDKNLEPVVMNICYLAMTVFVFIQVVLRFGFQNQIPWGGAVAIYLFIWVAWLGASYNIRTRSHLTFGIFREKLPYRAQFACLVADAFLWISLAVVVIYYSIDQVQSLKDNFAFVPGSFDLMQWWFYTIGPLGWGLIVLRALQNLWKDLCAFRRSAPFVLSGGLMAE